MGFTNSTAWRYSSNGTTLLTNTTNMSVSLCFRCHNYSVLRFIPAFFSSYLVSLCVCFIRTWSPLLYFTDSYLLFISLSLSLIFPSSLQQVSPPSVMPRNTLFTLWSSFSPSLNLHLISFHFFFLSRSLSSSPRHASFTDAQPHPLYILLPTFLPPLTPHQSLHMIPTLPASSRYPS